MGEGEGGGGLELNLHPTVCETDSAVRPTERARTVSPASGLHKTLIAGLLSFHDTKELLTVPTEKPTTA